MNYHTPINIVPGLSGWWPKRELKELIGLGDNCTGLSMESFYHCSWFIYWKNNCLSSKCWIPKGLVAQLYTKLLVKWGQDQEYLQSVIIPYVRRKRQELNLSDTFSTLAIFDVIKGQTTDAVYQMLRDNNIYVINIPANCKDKLQPMDLSINKTLKEGNETTV